ncbi:MAG: hypothetical protein C7B43_20295, partial [Sulfobacillus benefaciens]
MKTHWKVLYPLAASAALAIAVTVPVMAAGHGPVHVPSQAASHGSASSAKSGNHGGASISPHSPTVPSQASSHSPTVPSQASSHSAGSASSLPNQANQHASAASHQHGQSASVLADVQKMRALKGKIQTARQQYVAAIRAYLQAVSHTLATGKTNTIQTALSQLKTINITLAHTVQTEKTAQRASASTGSQSGTSALNNVIAT